MSNNYVLVGMYNSSAHYMQALTPPLPSYYDNKSLYLLPLATLRTHTTPFAHLLAIMHQPASQLLAVTSNMALIVARVALSRNGTRSVTWSSVVRRQLLLMKLTMPTFNICH